MNMNRYPYKTVSMLTVVLCVAAICFGCAPTNENGESFYKEWKVRAEQGQPYAPPKRKPVLDRQTKKLLKELESAADGGKPLPVIRTTIRVRDIDVKTMLQGLARAANQNIVFNQDIEGRVTLDVRNVPWDQVFKGVLKTQGLGYFWEGAIIRVMKREDLDKEVKRDIRTCVIPIQYSDAESLKENLQQILTGSSRDKKKKEGEAASTLQEPETVMVDKHTNSLIIHSTTAALARLVPIIEKLDRPTPQVLIEVHIVETTSETARELGVRWGGMYHHLESNQWVYPGVNSTGVMNPTIESGTDPTLTTLAGAENYPELTQATGLTLGYLASTTGKSLLMAELSALQSNGRLNILSSPSITTLDNQVAIIESGREVPYQSVENGEVKTEFKDATLKLEVTPHVIDGQVLKLKIFTKKDEVETMSSNLMSIQGQIISENPVISTKKAETNVILLDGQTTVIGGLNKESVYNQDEGVPGAMNVPVLGWLFKTRQTEKSMNDVLIFITPHILKQKQPGGNAKGRAPLPETSGEAAKPEESPQSPPPDAGRQGNKPE